jgi:hypothetical protein
VFGFHWGTRTSATEHKVHEDKAQSTISFRYTLTNRDYSDLLPRLFYHGGLSSELQDKPKSNSGRARPTTLYLRQAGLTRNPTFRIFNAFGVGDTTRLRKPRSNANTHVVRNAD